MKPFLILLAVSSIGFSLAMSLGFAGGWVAPYALAIERLVLISLLGVAVGALGLIVMSRKKP
jgi:hypothetical protein